MLSRRRWSPGSSNSSEFAIDVPFAGTFPQILLTWASKFLRLLCREMEQQGTLTRLTAFSGPTHIQQNESPTNQIAIVYILGENVNLLALQSKPQLSAYV
jgi:hypothetical protein